MSGKHDRAHLQDAKRELIKLGLDRGYVTREDFESYLPTEHMSPTEIEMMHFTLSSMEIGFVDDQASEDDQ